MILEDSCQSLDYIGIEAKALGTRNQFGVEESLEFSMAECDTREMQSTSLFAVTTRSIVHGRYSRRTKRLYIFLRDVRPRAKTKEKSNAAIDPISRRTEHHGRAQ